MNRQSKIGRSSRPAAAAIEYCIIAALLSAATIFSAPDLADKLSATVTNMVWNLKAS
jgi:Flp pilus assembly pilin Flp